MNRLAVNRVRYGYRYFACFYDDRVLEYVRMRPKRVAFQDLLQFDPRAGMTEHDLVRSARQVHETMPIRYARRIHEMNMLPYDIMLNGNMQTVYDWFQLSFSRLVEFPEILTIQQETTFTEMLPGMLANAVLPVMAKGAKELYSRGSAAADLRRFLDSALSSRISRRILAEHHVALHEQFYATEKNPNIVGILSLACDPVDIVSRTFSQAQRICRSYYGCSPKLEFLHSKPPAKFAYIPSHLEYILIELFKNALRATVEKTPIDARQDELPRIQVAIFSGSDEITIKVVDHAGGIHPDKLAAVWQYAYTTVKSQEDNEDMGIQALAIGSKNMAGEGFGLPMARIYAQYFGGDLTMQSVFGHGTEVYIRLKHLHPQLITSPLTDPDSLRDCD